MKNRTRCLILALVLSLAGNAALVADTGTSNPVDYRSVYVYASILYAGSFDFNRDGVINAVDIQITYDIFTRIAANPVVLRFLPLHLRNALDFNRDGLVNALDAGAIGSMIKSIMRVAMYAETLRQGSLDFNNDGKVNEGDVTVTMDIWMLIFPVNVPTTIGVMPNLILKNLSPEHRKALDYNADGMIDRKDCDLIVAKIKDSMLTVKEVAVDSSVVESSVKS